MRVCMFYQSLVSDWNNGNAHFLRGVARELLERRHQVQIFEPEDSWSFQNLLRSEGRVAIHGFRREYPMLRSERYRLEQLDLDRLLDGADLVLVHEWNEPALIRRLARHRRSHPYRLLFHDTHHRSATTSDFFDSLRLRDYDGVLAFGGSLAERYRRHGWSDRIWVWHEAADVKLFRPLSRRRRRGDLVWIGNWGDGERSRELEQFLLKPVSRLGLKAAAYGVRYPAAAQKKVASHGVRYVGWLPNYRVPDTFARFLLTLHIPRRPYRTILAGIPTIRVFEALACGIPLLCSPWQDTEGLFRPGRDFWIARDGAEMTELIRCLVSDRKARADLAKNGRRTIEARHTCAHRVDELLEICRELGIKLPHHSRASTEKREGRAHV